MNYSRETYEAALSIFEGLTDDLIKIWALADAATTRLHMRDQDFVMDAELKFRNAMNTLEWIKGELRAEHAVALSSAVAEMPMPREGSA
jgi:hypothetical protein